MKRAVLLMLTNLALTGLLAACGSSTTANGSRPIFTPPADASGEADLVKFEPVPTGKPVYLGLLDSGGTLRLPTRVNEGATRAPLDVSAIKAILGDVPRVAASALVPAAPRRPGPIPRPSSRAGTRGWPCCRSSCFRTPIPVDSSIRARRCRA